MMAKRKISELTNKSIAIFLVFIIIFSIFLFPFSESKNIEKLEDFIAKRWREHTLGLWIAGFIAGILSIWATSKLISGAGHSMPETPLAGNKYCELCNWDNYTICTPERCAILGACYYQPVEDERGGLCLPKDCKAGRPDVNYIKAEFLIDRTSLWKSFSSSGCPDTKDGCGLNIPINISHKVDTVRITLDTEEAGECYYIIDKRNAKIEEMTKIPYDENGNFFLKHRVFEIDISTLELGKTHTIYFKCRSTCDVRHDEGFDWNYIKFTFEEKPDELPSIIVRVYPDDKRQFLSDEDKYALIEVWLDENGHCAYSDKGWYLNLTKNASVTKGCEESYNNTLMCHFGKRLRWPQCNNNYFVQQSYCKQNQQCAVMDDMGNLIFLNKLKCTRCYINISLDECFADIINWSQLGEGLGNVEEYCKNNPNDENCSMIVDAMNKAREAGVEPTQLTGISKMFSLNFRCWDNANNLMPEEETYEYRIMTYPPYNMSIIKPENNSVTYEKEIYMEINTSRPTQCKYSIDKDTPYENMTFIDEVLDTNHSGYTPPLSIGQHTLYVKCRDIGGLERRDFVKFTIQKAPYPTIIRMFAQGNDLRIETDIKALCVYSVDENKKCNFNAFNATNFTTTNNYDHFAPLVYNWVYYVKCIDVWKDNPWPLDCTSIIIPTTLPRIS
jgi:hypothetical protein